MADVRLTVTGDTKLLEREIKKALKSGYQLGSLNTRGFAQPLGKIKGQLGEFEKSLEASNARVIAFGASTGAILAVSTALKGMVTSAVEVEKALTDINTILGASSANLAKFGDSLFSIANNTGQSFQVVAEAANEFARQGLGMEQTLARTNDALILTRISGMKAADSVAALTAVMNGFNKSAYQSSEITSKLAAVDAAFAVSSADLAEALRRVGSSAATAGVSLEELLGIVAATQQITARGGAVIGNSFKTIFTRVQRPKVIDALKKLGVETTNQQGAQLGLMKILSNLAKEYDGLSSRQQALVAEMVGGVFQVNVLKAALGDLGKEYSLYANAVNIANNASNEANQRNKQLNQTISAQLIQTLNNLVKAGSAVGKLTFGPAIEGSLKSINTLLGGLGGDDSEMESMGQKMAKGVLSGFGAVLKGPGIALLTLGLFKMFERLSKFSADALGSVLGFNKSGREAANIQAQIAAHLQKNPQILAAINSGLKTEKDLHAQILASIRAEQQGMVQIDRIAGSIATKMAKSGYKISDKGSLTSPGSKGTGRGGYSKGYVPTLSEKRFEESSARSLGADAGVKARFLPNVKAGGSKGIIANNKEDIITPKQFAKDYGVVPKGGESAIIPKYGSIGKKRKAELKRNLTRATKKSFSGGSIPNFVTIEDVNKWKQANAGAPRKFGKKKGAKKAQDTRPSAANMLEFLGENINSLPDDKIKQYSNLITTGVIRGNWPRSKGKAPTEETMSKLYSISGGQIGTSSAAGRKKDERIRTPLASADDKGALLPVLGMEQGKLPKVNQTTARFGLSPEEIPGFQKKFDNVFKAEYDTMVGRVASKMFSGLEGGQKMAKAFSTQELGADAEGPVKGAVFESFIRGMVKKQKQVSGQAVDIEKGGVREEFRHLFPEQLRDRPFEVRAGAITKKEAADKMQRSGVSMTLEEVGRFEVGGQESSVEEAMTRANRKQGRGLEAPSFADITKGSLTRNVKRMVLDKDFLRQKYNSMTPEESEAVLTQQGVKNVDQLFDKIAASAKGKGVSTTLINAAPGAGKTSFALGNKGVQISSLNDLNFGNKLAIVTARPQGENLVAKDFFKDMDRVIQLDVPKEEIQRRRALRDQQIQSGKSATGYGRAAGSTKYADTDFEAAEARLAEEFVGQPGRFKSLKAVKSGENWRFRSKRENEIKKIQDIPMVITTGAFTPPTSGHGRIFQEMQKVAGQSGAMPLAAVSTGTSREGDIGLSKAEKRRLIEMQHPGIATVGVHGTIPEVIKKDGELLRAIPSQSTVILGSDRVEDSVGERFRNKGFNVQEVKRDMEGSGMNQEALSATKVRTALSEGRMQDVAGALEPKIAEVLTNPQNVKRLKERANLIKRRDKELADFKKSSPVDAELNDTFAELTNLMVSKGLRKPAQGQITRMYAGITKARQDHPDINDVASQISVLRDKKKLQEKELLSRFNTELTRMQIEQQISFADGYVPNFAEKNKAFTPNRVILNHVNDGDSLNVDFYPSSKPRTSSSRLQGYDAFEKSGGTPEENEKGKLAKKVVEDYYAKQIGKDVTPIFRKAGTKESDRYGRPMFKDDALGKLLVSKGLATILPERATKGDEVEEKKKKKKSPKSAIRARRRADGYVPSFALADVFNAARRDIGEEWSWEKESGIKNALSREESFGKKGRVLFSNRLQQPVVVNQGQINKYGKSADKIISKDHINRGQGNSVSNLGKTGSGKEQYSDGYVPNFVFDAMGVGMLGYLAQFESLNKALNPLAAKMEASAKSTERYAMTLGKAETHMEILNNEVKELGGISSRTDLKGDVEESFKRFQQTGRGKRAGAAAMAGGGGVGSVEQAQFVEFKKQREGMLRGARTRVESLGSAVRERQTEQEALQAQSDRQDKIRGASAAGSMGVGFVASSIAGGMSDQSSVAARGLGSLGEAASMASTAMFMLPGPAGLLAGGIIGATKAISGVHSTFTDIGPKLQKAAETSREKFQKLSDSTQKYATIFQKLQTAYSDSSTSVETLTRLEDQMANAIADLPDKYRAEMTAVSNLTDMQTKLAKILDEEGKKMQQKTLAADLGKRIDDANDLIFDDDLFKDTKSGRQKRRNEADEIVKQVGEDDLAALAQAAGQSAKEFEKLVSSLASVTPELSQALAGFTQDVGDDKENQEAIRKAAEERQRSIKISKQSAEVLKAGREAQQRRNREEQRAIEVLNQSTASLIEFAKGAAGRVDTADRLRGEDRASQVRIKLNEAQNRANRMSQFVGPNTVAEVQDKIKLAELENRQQLERENALISARGSAGDQLMKAIAGVQFQVTKQSESPGGKSGRGITPEQDQEKQIAAIKKITDLQLKLRGEGAGFDEIAREIRNLVKTDDNIKEVLGPAQILKLEDAIRSGQDKITEKLANLNRTQLEEKKILTQNLKANLQKRLDKKDLSMGGGITAFLDPKSFQSIADEFQAGFQLLSRGGSSITTGRGATKVASSVAKFMGGSVPDSPVFDRLRSQGVQGIAANMKLNRDQMAGIARSRGDEGLARELENMTDDDFARAATKQFDNLVKMENGVLGNLADANTTLDAILAQLQKMGGDSKSVIASAAEEAKKPTAESEIAGVAERTQKENDERARSQKIALQTKAKNDARATLMQGYESIVRNDESTKVDGKLKRIRLNAQESIDKGGLAEAQKAFNDLKREMDASIDNIKDQIKKAKGDDKEDLTRKLNNLVAARSRLFDTGGDDQNNVEKITKLYEQASKVKSVKVKPGQTPTARTKPAARPAGAGAATGIPAVEGAPAPASGGITGAAPQRVEVEMPDISQMSGEDCCSKLTALIRLTEKGNNLLSAHRGKDFGGGSNQESTFINRKPPRTRFEQIDKKPFTAGTSPVASTAMGLTPKGPEIATAISAAKNRATQRLNARSMSQRIAGQTAGGNERIGADGTIREAIGKRFRASKFGRRYGQHRSVHGMNRGRIHSALRAGASGVMDGFRSAGPMAQRGIESARQSVEGLANRFGNLRIPRLGDRTISQRIAGQTAGGNERIAADGTMREAMGKRFRASKFGRRYGQHRAAHGMNRGRIHSALRAGASGVMDSLRGTTMPSMQGVRDAAVRGYDRAGSAMSRGIQGARTGLADFRTGFATGSPTSAINEGQMGSRVHTSRMQRFGAGIKNIPQTAMNLASSAYNRAGSAMSRGIQGARTGLADFRTGFATGSSTTAINEGQMGSRVQTSRMQRFGAGVKNAPRNLLRMPGRAIDFVKGGGIRRGISSATDTVKRLGTNVQQGYRDFRTGMKVGGGAPSTIGDPRTGSRMQRLGGALKAPTDALSKTFKPNTAIGATSRVGLAMGAGYLSGKLAEKAYESEGSIGDFARAGVNMTGKDGVERRVYGGAEAIQDAGTIVGGGLALSGVAGGFSAAAAPIALAAGGNVARNAMLAYGGEGSVMDAAGANVRLAANIGAGFKAGGVPGAVIGAAVGTGQTMTEVIDRNAEMAEIRDMAKLNLEGRASYERFQGKQKEREMREAGGDQAVFATFERLKSEYTAATSEAEASRAENIGLGKELFGWLPGVEDAGAITSEAAKNLEDATDALRQEAERITGQSIGKDKSSGEIMNIVGAFKEAAREQKLQARVKAEKQKKEKQSEILRSDEYARFHGGAFSLQDSANFATERGQGLIANILTQLLKCCREDDSMMGIQQAVDSLKEPMARIPEEVKDGAKDGVSGTAKETSKGAKEGAKQGTESAAPAVENASESGSKKGSESGAKKGTKEGVQQSGFGRERAPVAFGGKNQASRIIAQSVDAVSRAYKEGIERDSGQRFNEGIMAKPPMSADDMVVGPNAYSTFLANPDMTKRPQQYLTQLAGDRNISPSQGFDAYGLPKPPKRPKKPPVGTIGEAASGTMPGTRPTTASNTGLMSAFDPSKQSARISRAPRPPQSTTMQPRQIDPRPVKETPSGITGLRIGGKTFSTGNSMMNNDPAVVKNLEEAQKNLHEAKKAFVNLSMEAQKTGTDINEQQAMAAAANVTSAQRKADQALLDHMDYFSAEKERERINKKYNVQDLGTSGRVPEGMVTPIFNSGVNMSNVPSRDETIRNILSEQLPEGPNLQGAMDSANNQMARGIEGIVQGASKEATQQERMIGVLKDIRDRLPTANERQTHNRPLPSSSSGPAGDLLPADPNLFSGAVPNFSTKQAGIKLEESLAGSIPGYGKVKGRYDKKVGGFVNNKEFVASQSDLKGMGLNADGPLVMPPQSTMVGRERMQELKQKLAFSGKVPNFGYPPGYFEDRDRMRDRLRERFPNHAPGHVNMGGKQVPIDDKWITHAHEKGMELQSQGKIAEAAWWFARRNGLGKLKHPGARYGSSDAKTVERQLNQAQLAAVWAGPTSDAMEEDENFGMGIDQTIGAHDAGHVVGGFAVTYDPVLGLQNTDYSDYKPGQVNIGGKLHKVEDSMISHAHEMAKKLMEAGRGKDAAWWLARRNGLGNLKYPGKYGTNDPNRLMNLMGIKFQGTIPNFQNEEDSKSEETKTAKNISETARRLIKSAEDARALKGGDVLKAYGGAALTATGNMMGSSVDTVARTVGKVKKNIENKANAAAQKELSLGSNLELQQQYIEEIMPERVIKGQKATTNIYEATDHAGMIKDFHEGKVGGVASYDGTPIGIFTPDYFGNRGRWMGSRGGDARHLEGSPYDWQVTRHREGLKDLKRTPFSSMMQGLFADGSYESVLMGKKYGAGVHTSANFPNRGSVDPVPVEMDYQRVFRESIVTHSHEAAHARQYRNFEADYLDPRGTGFGWYNEGVQQAKAEIGQYSPPGSELFVEKERKLRQAVDDKLKAMGEYERKSFTDNWERLSPDEQKQISRIMDERLRGNIELYDPNNMQVFYAEGNAITSEVLAERQVDLDADRYIKNYEKGLELRKNLTNLPTALDNSPLLKKLKSASDNVTGAYRQADHLIRHGNVNPKYNLAGKSISNLSKGAAIISAPGTEVLTASLQSASAFNALNAQQQKLALEQMGIDINNPEAVSSLDMFGYTLKEYASPLWRDSVTMRESYNQMAGTGEQGFARQFYGKKGQKAWDAFNKASFNEMVSGKAHNLTGNKTVDNMAQFAIDNYALSADIAKDMGSQAIGMVGGLGQLGVSAAKGGVKGVSKGHNWITDKLSTPVSWLYNQGNVPNFQKELDSAISRETNGLMDMYGLSKKDALGSVRVGTNSAIKANPLEMGVWNDFQEKSLAHGMSLSSNNRNLIGATGSVPNFQSAAEAQALKGITTGKGSDGGAVDRIVSGLKEIKYAIQYQSRRMSNPAPASVENPQSFNEFNMTQAIDNLIDGLKIGIQDIVTSIGESQEQNNEILNIGPVKIDEASINSLAAQFGISMEVQISRLIEVVREVATTMGEGASVAEIMGTIQHKLSVTHGGNLNVNADDAVKQIWPRVQSYVEQQINRQQQGGEFIPTPTQNTGPGTQ